MRSLIQLGIEPDEILIPSHVHALTQLFPLTFRSSDLVQVSGSLLQGAYS